MSKKVVPCIALLTDFGLQDQYAASIKGVILSINPSANIIDITHEIQPYRTRQAAYVLWSTYGYFPKGTIFVNVVDPGVGSKRRIIIIKTNKYIFIAPDNGLLDFILHQEKKSKVIEVKQSFLKELFSGSISSTFHGRDIIAPIAAHISNNVPLQRFGKTFSMLETPYPFIISQVDEITARILHIDRFGNIITNIKSLEIEKSMKEIQALSAGSNMITKWIRFYDEAPDNTPCLVVGSGDLVEISVKKNNAARFLNITLDSKLKVYWR
jgi:S-adenosyl-L-methionine hydrolase (adenosine-forming)